MSRLNFDPENHEDLVDDVEEFLQDRLDGDTQTGVKSSFIGKQIDENTLRVGMAMSYLRDNPPEGLIIDRWNDNGSTWWIKREDSA